MNGAYALTKNFQANPNVFSLLTKTLLKIIPTVIILVHSAPYEDSLLHRFGIDIMFLFYVYVGKCECG